MLFISSLMISFSFTMLREAIKISQLGRVPKWGQGTEGLWFWNETYLHTTMYNGSYGMHYVLKESEHKCQDTVSAFGNF